jgi:hypothetical protein
VLPACRRAAVATSPETQKQISTAVTRTHDRICCQRVGCTTQLETRQPLQCRETDLARLCSGFLNLRRMPPELGCATNCDAPCLVPPASSRRLTLDERRASLARVGLVVVAIQRSRQAS